MTYAHSGAWVLRVGTAGRWTAGSVLDPHPSAHLL